MNSLPEYTKNVVEQILWDRVGKPVSLAEEIGGGPIFLIRSACPELFESFVMELHECSPEVEVHVLSHAKDRQLVQDVVRNPYVFHEYPVMGPYLLSSVKRTLSGLREIDFSAKVMLDQGGALGGMDEVLTILDWINGESAFVWSRIGPSLLRLASENARSAADNLLLSLGSWVNSSSFRIS